MEQLRRANRCDESHVCQLSFFCLRDQHNTVCLGREIISVMNKECVEAWTVPVIDINIFQFKEVHYNEQIFSSNRQGS